MWIPVRHRSCNALVGAGAAAMYFFCISSAQAQSPEAGGAVIVTYTAGPGLLYDRCAKAGFAEPLQPSAEQRFEVILKKMESETPDNPRIPADEYKKVISGTRKGWEKLKILVAESPDSDFTQEKCREHKAQFDKNRKWFPAPK